MSSPRVPLTPSSLAWALPLGARGRSRGICDFRSRKVLHVKSVPMRVQWLQGLCRLVPPSFPPPAPNAFRKPRVTAPTDLTLLLRCPSSLGVKADSLFVLVPLICSAWAPRAVHHSSRCTCYCPFCMNVGGSLILLLELYTQEAKATKDCHNSPIHLMP